jgi:hypothetical protein
MLHGPPEGGVRLMGTAVEHDGTRIGNIGVGNLGVATAMLCMKALSSKEQGISRSKAALG